MLKIRLQRVGKTNDPYFRLIVTPHTHKAKTGKATEILGSYNVQAGEYKFKADRIKYWLSVGAQVSPTVRNVLIDQKIMTGNKARTLNSKVKKEGKKK
jgi:small subunit ribosomal protein S16